MNRIDIIFLVILAVSVIRVTAAGFIDEFFSKAAVIGGGLAAVIFYKSLTPFIEKLMGTKSLSAVISFLILFLGFYLIVKIMQVIIGSLFESPSLKSLDRALGFFLGLIEGFIITVIILMLINLQPFFPPENVLKGSFIAEFLSPFILTIWYI